jgi:hypothetical protein
VYQQELCCAPGNYGSFSFDLPELFPTRLKATGSGFCCQPLSAGRLLKALGPFQLGEIAARQAGAMEGVFQALVLEPWIGLISAGMD